MPATFRCDVCGSDAGTVETDDSSVIVETFLGRGTLYDVDVRQVEVALAAGDAALVFAADRELAPFWCERCAKVYCRDHWDCWNTFDDGFFDATRGRCPEGHERCLWD